MTILNETDADAIDADIGRAVALHRDGKPDEAEELYRKILKSAPDHSGVLHNLGVVLAEAGKAGDALGLFDRAIAGRPDYTHAHVNRGGALQSLGRLEHAAEAYGRALALEPDLYPIQLRQALALLALRRRGGAMDHFAATHALRRGEAPADRTSRLKIAHDAAQFRHLAAKGIEPDRFQALAALYDEVISDIAWPDDASAAIDIPADWQGRLEGSHNRPLYRAEAPALPGPALNPALDTKAVTEAYGECAPGIAAIDGLLDPDALSLLRGFLLDSTIWYDCTHIAGFLAAYLEDGMACPLLLQFAAELRHAFPEILGPHPLQQGWAFKCLTGDRGIDVHADAGAVSVNLWITQDAANRDRGAGGLVIHRAQPPGDWALTDYHGDIAPIRRFLAENDAGAVTVPHGENRAALFRSDLFHESGAVDFSPEYGRQRINITLLFGDREG